MFVLFVCLLLHLFVCVLVSLFVCLLWLFVGFIATVPMEDSRVEILTKLSDNIRHRPEIEVYVRTFDGFALTADTWESQRQILLDDLIGKKVTKLRLCQ